MKKTTKTNKDIFAFSIICALALLEVLGLILIFTVPIGRYDGKYTLGTWTTFKYFTTDSNVIMLIACIISIIFIAKQWKGKINKMPEWTYIVKLTATAGVALTFFVTVFFLMPICAISGKYPVGSLFIGSNMFLHLVCPILAIILFLLFENRKDIKFVKILYGLIPVLIYGIFYLSMAYTHVGADGKIPTEYDWYAFCAFGPIITPFIIIGVLGIYFLFLWLFWFGNKKIHIKSLD